MADDIIHNGHEPDMMCHFHNIVGFAVHPKIDVTQLAQGVIALEPGKGDDTYIQFYCQPSGIDHIC